MLSNISDPVILISPDNDKIVSTNPNSTLNQTGLEVYTDHNQLMYWNEKFRNLVKGYTNMNMNDVATKNQKDFLKVKMFEVPSEVKK